jgi:hypothetical protein
VPVSLREMPAVLLCHRQSSSASRFTAGASGFLNLSPVQKMKE